MKVHTGNRYVIAQGPMSAVERCACGSVYLTVGPVTMKLHPEALTELRDTIARALRVLGLRADVMTSSGSLPGEAATREPGEGGEGDDDRGGQTDGSVRACDRN